YIKNPNSKRTKAFKKIHKGIPHLLILTGTPIESKPIDIYNIVQAIDPSSFPNYVKFTLDYCDAKSDRYGWNTSGSKNTIKLNKILTRKLMIRRKKKDVLKELPSKMVSHLPIEINNRTEYIKAENKLIDYIGERFDKDLQTEEDFIKDITDYAKRHEIDLENKNNPTEEDIKTIKELKIEKASAAVVLSQIRVLMQLATEGKMEGVINWIRDFLESGEKLVLFAINKKIINALMKEFKDVAVKVDGSVKGKKRQDAVDKFQEDPKIQLFIGNIIAAGVGLTLTAASNVAILQLPWDPGKLNQAIDRVHRISQLRQVTVWYLLAQETIEGKLLEVLMEKEKTVSEVLDGKQYVEKSMLQELINKYRRKAA
ncbi:MAG: DEAD/DEAH box helicase, partial [bacterium]